MIAFANRLREAFKGVPVVIGGIEASLRFFSQYDLVRISVEHTRDPILPL